MDQERKGRLYIVILVIIIILAIRIDAKNDEIKNLENQTDSLTIELYDYQ